MTKSRLVEIEDAKGRVDSSPEHAKLLVEINRLEHDFNKLRQEFSNQNIVNEYDTSITNSHLLNSYIQLMSEGLEFINGVETTIQTQKKEPVYYVDLIKNLKDYNLRLQNLNNTIKKTIINLGFHSYLLPNQDSAAYRQALAEAFETLSASLKKFTEELADFKLNPTQKSEHKDFIEDLALFIYQLFNKIMLLPNTNAAAKIREYFLNHLGKESSRIKKTLNFIIDTGSPIKDADQINFIEKESIEGFILELFPDSPNWETLDGSLQHATAHIYNLIEKLDSEIPQKLRDINQYNHNYTQLEQKQKKLSAICYEHLNRYNRELVKLKSRIETVFNHLGSHGWAVELQENIAVIESCLAITKRIEAELTEVSDAQDGTMTSLHVLAKTETEAAKTLESVGSKISSIRNYSKLLDTNYSNTKENLRLQLNKLMTEATFVLAYNQKDTSLILTPVKKLAVKLNDKGLTQLIDLKHVEEEIDSIKALIERETAAIIAKKETQLNDVNQRILELKPLKLNRINPFIQEIPKHFNLVAKKQLQLAQIINNNNHLSLTNWLTEVDKQLLAIDNLIQNHEGLQTQAQIIEQRLRDPNYRLSLIILSKVKQEYGRIAKRKCARIKPRNNPQFIYESVMFCLNSPTVNNDMSNFLNQIDPRLLKLKAICDDFSLVNTVYINRNTLLLNDDRYINRLISNVNDHLFSKRLMSISDGVKPKFVQWVRRHMVQPLENARHHVAQRIKHKEKSYSPTMFAACKTEQALKGIALYVKEKLYSEESSLGCK